MEDDDEVAERMMRMSERAMEIANSIPRVMDLYDRSLLITAAAVGQAQAFRRSRVAPGERMKRATLVHLLEIEWLGGCKSVPISAEQADRFSRDENAVLAEVLGCSVAEYEIWLELRGRAQCCASTAAGVRCRGTVPGIQFQEPAALAAYGGGYCFSHGDVTAA